MSRILANIILILIIAFTVSAVPINTELLNLNITLPEQAAVEPEEAETTPVDENPKLELTYQDVDFDYLYNPKSVEFKFVGSSSLDSQMIEAFTEEIQLEIFKGNTESNETIVKRLASSDISPLADITINGDVATLAFDISDSSLQLSNGHYTLEFSSNNEVLKSEFKKPIEASYFDDVTYNPPKASPNRGNRIITIFFTDESKSYLVPVSKEVRDNGKLIRTTLNALRDGPASDSGLNLESPAPYVPVARFSTVTETVSLETNGYENAPFTQTADDTYLMMHSLINTMTYIENVSSVKFSVDKKDNEPLNGFDLSRSYPRPTEPKAHLGLQVYTNRLYLVPVEVDANSASEMIGYLKHGVENMDNLHIPVIPNIDIVNESLIDGVLKVTLSDEITKAYPSSEIYARYMMDSIVLSLNTLPEVEEIILETESRNSGELHGYQLGESFKPARYLNME